MPDQVHAGPKCMRVNCERCATHRLTLTLHATPDTPPATLDAGVLVCAAHATREDAEDVLNFGFDSVADTFTLMGRARPDRDYSSAKWVLLDA